jgi:hypothetical protein
MFCINYNFPFSLEKGRDMYSNLILPHTNFFTSSGWYFYGGISTSHVVRKRTCSL